MKRTFFLFLITLFSCGENNLKFGFLYLAPFEEGEVHLPYVVDFNVVEDGEDFFISLQFSKIMEKESVEANTYIYRITGDIFEGKNSFSSNPEKIDSFFWDEPATHFIIKFRPVQWGQYALLIKKDARDLFGKNIDGTRYKNLDSDFAEIPSDFVSSPFIYGNPRCPEPGWSTGKCFAHPSGGSYVRVKEIYIFSENEYPFCNYYCPGPSEPQGQDCGLINCGGKYDNCYLNRLFKAGEALEKRYFRIDFETPFPPGIDVKTLEGNLKIIDFNSGEEIPYSVGITHTNFKRTFDDLPSIPQGIKHIYLRPEGLKEGKTYILSINSMNSVKDMMGIPLRDENYDGMKGDFPDDEIRVYFATHTCKRGLYVRDYFCEDEEKGRICSVFFGPSGKDVILRAPVRIEDAFVCEAYSESERKKCEEKKPASVECCKAVPLQERKLTSGIYMGEDSPLIQFKIFHHPSPILIFLSHSISDVNGNLLDGNENYVGEGNFFDDWARIIK